jgi:hypothetical protein
MEAVTRSVLPFCGVEEGGFAGLINAEVRRCFVAALRDGTAAEFASIRSTIEGDPIATITRALPGGGLEILVDSTQDAYGARVWTRMICRGFVEDQKFGFVRDGCDEGVVIRPEPSATQPVPPTTGFPELGSIVFGESYDPVTLRVVGPRTTFGLDEKVAWVAAVGPVDLENLDLRIFGPRRVDESWPDHP